MRNLLVVIVLVTVVLVVGVKSLIVALKLTVVQFSKWWEFFAKI